MAIVNQRVGEYVLQEKINAGAFGEVWKASHHVWTDQLVAVKIPSDPQFLRSLQREGSAIHGLVHPNIVRAIGFDPYADVPYLTMEYVPGTSLRPLIQQKKVSVADAVSIMKQVLSGLEYAHKNNIVHRDIKPENVLVHERAFSDGFSTNGTIKVTDFGLGKAMATVASGSIAYSQSIDSPASREIAGTLDYMAPEQRNASEVDGRADLYAAGVVMYELLTGERPAGAELPSDLNPAVPKALDEAFRRAYARLDKRFSSAGEFLAALGPTLPPAMPRPAAAAAAAPATFASPSRPARQPIAPPPVQAGGCPSCRGQTSPDDQFCMSCGIQLVENVRRCPQCGAYPDPSDAFCIFCGQTLVPHLKHV